jgi:light-harvesting complex I chlorophyll a/b binding protein 2
MHGYNLVSSRERRLGNAGSEPEQLRWNAQAELIHGRWAMLAVVGILVPDLLSRWGFIDAGFSWYDAGSREYFADPWTLFISQMALMGWAEGRRWADLLHPGCVDVEPNFPNRKKPVPDVGYPGGLWFDWANWGRGSPEPVMVLRTKEIKNGRLAMLAFVGFWFQAVYTGQGPIDNLLAHIADPGHCNVFSVSAFCTSLLATRARAMLRCSLLTCMCAVCMADGSLVVSGFGSDLCRLSRPSEMLVTSSHGMEQNASEHFICTWPQFV